MNNNLSSLEDVEKQVSSLVKILVTFLNKEEEKIGSLQVVTVQEFSKLSE